MNLLIIVPVFNNAAYIDRCYQSIIELKNINFKVLFINDGSTDGSLDILEGIKFKDNRVEIYSQENKGAAAARNYGIKNSNSEYLFFLDADDTINAAALLSVYELAEKEQTEILGFMGEMRTSDGLIIEKSFKQPVPFNQVVDGRSILNSGFQPSSACFYLYKTEFLKLNHLFFMEGINEEDVELTARMFLPAKKVIFVDNKVYFYLKNENSVTNTKDEKRVKHYLNSVIVVAKSIMDHKSNIFDEELKTAIEKNANSVVWNLIWRLCKQKEVDKEFRLQCIQQLKDKQLYPIKGPLKTKFQKFTTMFFNIPFLIKAII